MKKPMEYPWVCHYIWDMKDGLIPDPVSSLRGDLGKGNVSGNDMCKGVSQ